MAGSFSILTNVASLNAQRNVGRTQQALAGNLGRLSSGLRIQTAADDAAGLAVSERLRSQIRSLGQAERNALDGVSMVQVAEGAMNEMSGILTRMRELAVQSANGTLGDSEREFLQTEFVALRDEIDRIASVTEFNGINLLDGSLASGVDFQVGINANSADTIALTVEQLDSTTIASGFDSLEVSSAGGASSALATIDDAISNLSSARSGLGSIQNRLNVTIANLGSARENLSAANSRIRDVDVASETAALTRNNILQQAGVAVLAQANQAPSIALSLLG
ncbi:MAG TPA: flagellin [Polyangiaceae bacterium LLY-WYZ-14_1]|jgi:flagellin|nr:flagellin [Polyangiaceae bacterium LLY-WYZ-14_1]